MLNFGLYHISLFIQKVALVNLLSFPVHLPKEGVKGWLQWYGDSLHSACESSMRPGNCIPCIHLHLRPTGLRLQASK
jgi:hypothetical protein